MKQWIILIAIALCSQLAIAEEAVTGNKGYVVGKPPDVIQAEKRSGLIDQALDQLSADKKETVVAEVASNEVSPKSAKNLGDLWAGIKQADEWINKNWW